MALEKTLEDVKARSRGKIFSYAEFSPTDRRQVADLKTTQDQFANTPYVTGECAIDDARKSSRIAMMKEQLNDLSDRTHGDIDSIRGELGRIFTMTEWFLGLMFTIAIGMFGLVLNSLKKEKPDAEKPASIDKG